MIAHFLTKHFLSSLQSIEYGALSVTTPDGKCYDFTGSKGTLSAHIYMHHWNVVPAFLGKGDIGLAETYRDGLWDTDNLVNLLLIALHNTAVMTPHIYGSKLFSFCTYLLYMLRRNTLAGSKRNIPAHYDLGNDFYALWLDPGMTYSSALFDHEQQTLEQAQYNKYDRIINQLAARSGPVLEIGCGWGGFAHHLLNYGDFAIKAITLSQNQYHYARSRLGTRADIALEDYRHQHGSYDYIVSIEMFEAVGERFWSTYFKKIQSLLSSKGKAMIQTIHIAEPYFQRYRKSGDMIRSFIFPGGMLPSFTRFNHEAERAGLRITEHFSFGHHYARTLKHWLHNFENNLPAIKALQFDNHFIRIWRFYLAICIAGFATERTNVSQIHLQHA